MVTAFLYVVQVGGYQDGGLTGRAFMVGEDIRVIVGVVLSVEEFLDYHAADEYRAGGEGWICGDLPESWGRGGRAWYKRGCALVVDRLLIIVGWPPR
jgi:hypothetical protein